MKLAIISHTEHYKTADGTVVGWSPTVNEINHLLEVFDTIYHVAMLYEGVPPASTMAYTDERVVFVPLRPSGGRSFLSKLQSIWQAPSVIRRVSKTLKQVDCFQLRTPTGIGVYLIPYLTLFSNKKGWYKYAGNWNQKHPPLGYRFQRFMLRHQKRKVTINGSWENQPKHCMTFENPCLTKADLLEGRAISAMKTLEGQLSFCYVGRLEKEKGVERIIIAMTSLSDIEKQRIKEVHLVGDGKEMAYFKTLSTASGISIIFHGNLSRKAVIEIYKQSHVFIMPTSASEGFPKVIAEAMNFGCIPIVSNVSAIVQYVRHEHEGYILENVCTTSIVKSIIRVLNLDEDAYFSILNNQRKVVPSFTFSYYHSHLKRILNLN